MKTDGVATDYDVLVAGGGPAGAATAAAACLAGLRVALVDDSDEQRWKLGESLPGAVLRSLRRLHIAGPEQLLAPDERERCAANVSAWGSDRWTYQDALADIRATLRNQPGRVASYEELLVVTRLYRIGAQDRQENVA